jgi:hypothetical protein
MGTRFIVSGLLVLLLTVSGACTHTVRRGYLPPPLSCEPFPDPVKVVTIPLPAVATTPNEGVTYGALTAFLFHDKQDEVAAIVAPQTYYNQYFGYTGAVYGAFFPKPDRNWEINLSQSTMVNKDYSARLRDGTLSGGSMELNAQGGLFTDGSARFFGFQSESRQSNESNYADSEHGVNILIGRDIATHLQLAFGERYRDVAIKQGAIKSLPFIRQVFTEEQVPGINGFTAHAQRLALIYNSLDSLTVPTKGLYGRAVFEISREFMGSSANYQHYEAELKRYVPARRNKYIAVARIAYSQALGDDVPFLERSILGGENTLRGYGRNRFIDNSYLLVNLEERIRVTRWRIFNVDTDVEIAPFLDIGSVMRDLSRITSTNLQFNPGMGIRGVVRPNVVGRIDIGVGREGAAVFVGLGYPF